MQLAVRGLTGRRPSSLRSVSWEGLALPATMVGNCAAWTCPRVSVCLHVLVALSLLNVIGALPASESKPRGAAATAPRAYWSDRATAEMESTSSSNTGSTQAGNTAADASKDELNYMMDIYKQRSHQVRESQDVEEKRKDEGRCQRPESTVIHSFPFVGKQIFLSFAL